MKNDRERMITKPDQLGSYFKMEWVSLLFVTASGLFYNVGMIAGPYFEGKLAQCLLDIMTKKKTVRDMAFLVALYMGTIVFVQGMRCVKRFYVRRFANNVSFSMRHVLFGNLVRKSKRELEASSMGDIMTRAIADVDACVEGMRKFTTEVFDTGVVLVAYLVMLFVYDWRLTLLSCMFTPVAYLIAEKLKKTVMTFHAVNKEKAGELNNVTIDRISNALLYRVTGREKNRDQAYEGVVREYEKSAVRANVWENTMQPVYHLITMVGGVFILFIGAENVMGNGFTKWDIAAFTTYLSCFSKMALKSSKAAKLFNAVQKAEVSWKRIKPWIRPVKKEKVKEAKEISALSFQDVSVYYEPGKPLFSNLSFGAKKGEIIGITGRIGCGKTALLHAILGEASYDGNMFAGERNLRELSEQERAAICTYMGHEPELLSGSIRDNILFGEEGDCEALLKRVCLYEEVSQMPDGIDTLVGNGGISLSGGQQARVALARTLFHAGDLVILDDPFSALDKQTEREIMQYIEEFAADKIVLLFSHRLSLFPKLSKVVWLGEQCMMGTHDEMMEKCPDYRTVFEIQMGGASHEE